MSLIGAEELLERIGDPAVIPADVRWWLTDPGKGRRDYEAAHLPGAVFVDLDTDLVAATGPGRHPLPAPADFARRMEALGIGDESEVVAYDDAGGSVAARLWWMLEDLGFTRVRVLDGGIGAWVAAGGSLTDAVVARPPGRLTLRDRWSRVIEREALAARLDAGERDAAGRSRTGAVPRRGRAGGPGGRATSPELTPSRGRATWRRTDASSPPMRSRERFSSLGGEVVTSCGSGVNACHNALALRVAGLPDPLLYPGSYSDWSRAGWPVATGEDPS